jgi:hypothetical protein
MPDIQPLPREIVLLEQAAGYLAECQDLDEVKSLIDQAEVMRLYRKKIGDSLRIGVPQSLEQKRTVSLSSAR